LRSAFPALAKSKISEIRISLFSTIALAVIKSLLPLQVMDIRLLEYIKAPGGVSMHVSKWGNSLAIRLPAAVVETLDLKEGDEIEIEVTGARRFAVKKAPGTRELLARIRKYRGRLPADFKFDRLEANARR
jgi:antitoxin MazE